MSVLRGTWQAADGSTHDADCRYDPTVTNGECTCSPWHGGPLPDVTQQAHNRIGHDRHVRHTTGTRKVAMPDPKIIPPPDADRCPMLHAYYGERVASRCALALDHQSEHVREDGEGGLEIEQDHWFLPEVTCGYEPCDGGPCLRPEAHEARERGDGMEDES